MKDPVVDQIVVHIARVAAGELPEAAWQAAKVFIADSLGVGIAGANAPWRREVLDMAAPARRAGAATVLATRDRLPGAPAATGHRHPHHPPPFGPGPQRALGHP